MADSGDGDAIGSVLVAIAKAPPRTPPVLANAVALKILRATDVQCGVALGRSPTERASATSAR
jgi:hypothetical protein